MKRHLRGDLRPPLHLEGRRPSRALRAGRGKLENASSIAASDCAPAAVISINSHGPTATTAPVIGIVVIDPPSVMAFTITGAANVYPNTARPDVHTLSQGWCRSRRSHGPSETERD